MGINSRHRQQLSIPHNKQGVLRHFEGKTLSFVAGDQGVIKTDGSQPISRVLCGSLRSRDSHSSWRAVTRALQPPTRKLGGSRHRLPMWCCSGCRLPRFTRHVRARNPAWHTQLDAEHFTTRFLSRLCRLAAASPGRSMATRLCGPVAHLAMDGR